MVSKAEHDDRQPCGGVEDPSEEDVGKASQTRQVVHLFMIMDASKGIIPLIPRSLKINTY